MNAAEVLEIRLWLGAVADTAKADGNFGLRDMATRAQSLIDDLRTEREIGYRPGDDVNADRYALVWTHENVDKSFAEGPYTEYEAMERRTWLWDFGSVQAVELFHYNGCHGNTFRVTRRVPTDPNS